MGTQNTIGSLDHHINSYSQSPSEVSEYSESSVQKLIRIMWQTKSSVNKSLDNK